MSVAEFADGRPLPLVPHGWSWTTLSELLSGIEAGKSFKCEERPPTGEEYGLVKVSAVTWGTYNEQESKTITQPEQVQERYRIKVGDLLFSRANTIELVGASVIVHEVRKNLLLSDKILRLQAPENLKHWINWFLRSRTGRLQIEALSTGNQDSMRNIGQERIGQIRVPVAPPNEVKRVISKIDELFSRIDEGERALERVSLLVERYRQSVLKAAVTGELTRAWREKNKDTLESGEALLARILTARREAWEKAELAKMKAKGITPANDKWKQKYEEPESPDNADLPALPEGWTWASLAQLSWASTYGTSQKCDAAGSGVAVLRIPNIRGGAFNFEDIKYATSDLGLETGDALASGDLLVIRTNGSESLVGVGAALMADTPSPCYFASYLIRFRLVLPSALSEWVNFCWQSHVVRQFIHEHKATSAGQYNVSQSTLMTLCLPVPPVDEINRAVDELKSSLSKSGNAAALVSAQLRHSSALRQGVLKSAFSGVLVCQSPTDEPASALLERIAAERVKDDAAPRRSRKKKITA